MILLLATAALADWSVEASINRPQIGIEDNLTLTVTVMGDKLNNLTTPQLGDNDDWAVVSTGSSTSTNIQLVGGRMTQSRTVTTTMLLAPKRKGTLTVPSLPVSANNETKHTDQFRVEVVDGSVSPRPQHRTHQQPRPQAPPTPSSQEIGENLFLSTHVDKREAFVGEQITATFTLYTQYNLGQASMSREPSFTGFWAHEMFRATQLDYQRRTIDDKVYNTVVLSRYAIFPLSSGDRTIEPMELEATVLTRRDFWGFFSQGDKVKVTGRPTNLKIKPLPAGAPSGFDGLVGEFSVTTEVSKDSALTNEAISYVITISGTGNIRQIRMPRVEFPPGFDLFDTQEAENIFTDGGKVSGTKRFEFILVPRSDGEFVMPNYSVSFFNPGKERYETSVSKPLRVIVGRGADAETSGFQPVVRGEVIRVGEDIRHIAPDCESVSTSSNENELVFLYYLLSFELLIILIGISIARRRSRLESDEGYARYTRALKRAMKELKKANELAGNMEAFVGAVQNGILHYLADRLGLPKGGVVYAEIRDKLAERRVDDATLDAIEGFLEKSNFLRFAPGVKEEAEREMVNEARELIKKVDRVFK